MAYAYGIDSFTCEFISHVKCDDLISFTCEFISHTHDMTNAHVIGSFTFRMRNEFTCE